MNGIETETHRKPVEPAHSANESGCAKPQDFARRTMVTISKLPSSLDAQLRSRPYQAFGIALAIGAGSGILLRSRILRTVIASAASYAIIELGRAYLRDAWPATQEADKS
jgi:hypothetical protein